jgi:exonuclease SbcD
VTDSTLRILHVSDIHVEEPDDAACVALLASTARIHAVDAMVIVGDFFDHNRVSDQTLQAVIDALALSPVPVVVLPGNHDPALAGSVYFRGDFGAHVHVLTEAGGQTLVLADLDAAIWGKPHTSYDTMRPLQGIPPRGSERWHIVLAHGHLVRGPDDIGRAYPISPAEIAESDRDYIALGHWDVPADASVGGVAASYSGSPSRLRTCAIVTLRRVGGATSVSVENVAL